MRIKQPKAVRTTIDDAYYAGYARGVKSGATVMRDYLIVRLRPVTPELKRLLHEMCEASVAAGLAGKAAADG